MTPLEGIEHGKAKGDTRKPFCVETLGAVGCGGGPDLAEKELSNGRLAMMAFSGILTQSVLTGGGFPYTYNGVVDLVPPIAGGEGLPGGFPAICASGIGNGCR